MWTVSVRALLVTGVLLTSRAQGYDVIIQDGELVGGRGFSATVTSPALVSPSSPSSFPSSSVVGGDMSTVSAASAGGGGGAGEVTLSPGGALRVSLLPLKVVPPTAAPNPTASYADTRALVLVLGAPVTFSDGSSASMSPRESSLVVEVWVAAGGGGAENNNRDDRTTGTPPSLWLAATCALRWRGGATNQDEGWRVHHGDEIGGDGGNATLLQRCSVHSLAGGDSGSVPVAATATDTFVRVEITLEPPPHSSAAASVTQAPRRQWHEVGMVVVRETSGASEVRFIARGLVLVSLSDLVELSWAWLTRAARCSSELYSSVLSSCGIASSPGVGAMSATTMTVDTLVNGCCAAAVAFSSAGCMCALDVFTTSSVFQGAMAAARDVNAMGDLSGYLLGLCGVSEVQAMSTAATAATTSEATWSSSMGTSASSVEGCVDSSAMMAALRDLVRENYPPNDAPPLTSSVVTATTNVRVMEEGGDGDGDDGGDTDGDGESSEGVSVQEGVAAQSASTTAGTSRNATAPGTSGTAPGGSADEPDTFDAFLAWLQGGPRPEPMQQSPPVASQTGVRTGANAGNETDDVTGVDADADTGADADSDAVVDAGVDSSADAGVDFSADMNVTVSQQSIDEVLVQPPTDVEEPTLPKNETSGAPSTSPPPAGTVTGERIVAAAAWVRNDTANTTLSSSSTTSISTNTSTSAINTSIGRLEGVEETYLSEEDQSGKERQPRRRLTRWLAGDTVVVACSVALCVALTCLGCYFCCLRRRGDGDTDADVGAAAGSGDGDVLVMRRRRRRPAAMVGV